MKHDRRNRRRSARPKHYHRNRLENHPCGCDVCQTRAGISPPVVARERARRALLDEERDEERPFEPTDLLAFDWPDGERFWRQR
jgi:hypothetical protein